MMYDENCFERWSERMEEDYLSQDSEPETHKCCGYDCNNEAVVQIDGDWYCSEHAIEVEEINKQDAAPDKAVSSSVRQ